MNQTAPECDKVYDEISLQNVDFIIHLNILLFHFNGEKSSTAKLCVGAMQVFISNTKQMPKLSDW